MIRRSIYVIPASSTVDMDLLLAEISNKRKDLASSSPASSQQGNGASKYMRRGDLERAKQEEEKRLKEEEDKRRRDEKERKEKEKVRSQCFTFKRRRGQKTIPDTRCLWCYRVCDADCPSLLSTYVQKDRLALLRRDRASSSRSPEPGSSRGDTPGAATSGAEGAGASETFNISSAECIRRLRAKGEPILLFGETEKERRLRLRALELLEEREGNGAAAGQGLNDWKKAVETLERDGFAKEIEQRRRTKDGAAAAGGQGVPAPGTGKGKGKEEHEGEREMVSNAPDAASAAADTASADPYANQQVLDLALVKSDPKKVYPMIYYALKGLLKEWGEALEQRPGE